MRKIPLLAILTMLFTGFAVHAADAEPTCHEYGCADCSCVAGNEEIQAKMPNVMSEIKKILIANRIPPASVKVILGGENPNGAKLDLEQKPQNGVVQLYDKSPAGFSCFDGCICCKWTFEGKAPE